MKEGTGGFFPGSRSARNKKKEWTSEWCTVVRKNKKRGADGDRPLAMANGSSLEGPDPASRCSKLLCAQEFDRRSSSEIAHISPIHLLDSNDCDHTSPGLTADGISVCPLSQGCEASLELAPVDSICDTPFSKPDQTVFNRCSPATQLSDPTKPYNPPAGTIDALCKSLGIQNCLTTNVGLPIKVVTCSPDATIVTPKPLPTHHGTNVMSWGKPAELDLVQYGVTNSSFSLKNAVDLDPDEVKRCIMEYKNAVVGRVWNKNFQFSWICSQLRKKWDRLRSWKIQDLGHHFFVLVFSSADDRDFVLKGGPWHIGGFPIGFTAWKPGLRPSSDTPLEVPTWVQFQSLPLEFWSGPSLYRIASTAGEPICIDRYTATRERSSFARVCIRCDYSKPLRKGCWVSCGGEGRFFQKFCYEVPSLCTQCGVVGHFKDHCAKPPASPSDPVSDKSLLDDETFPCKEENWIVVQKRRNLIQLGRSRPTKVPQRDSSRSRLPLCPMIEPSTVGEANHSPCVVEKPPMLDCATPTSTKCLMPALLPSGSQDENSNCNNDSLIDHNSNRPVASPHRSVGCIGVTRVSTTVSPDVRDAEPLLQKNKKKKKSKKNKKKCRSKGEPKRDSRSTSMLDCTKLPCHPLLESVCDMQLVSSCLPDQNTLNNDHKVKSNVEPTDVSSDSECEDLTESSRGRSRGHRSRSFSRGPSKSKYKAGMSPPYK